MKKKHIFKRFILQVILHYIILKQIPYLSENQYVTYYFVIFRPRDIDIYDFFKNNKLGLVYHLLSSRLISAINLH